MALGGQASVSFKDVVQRVLDRSKESYDGLSAEARRRLQRSIQDSLEFAWDFNVWPDLRKFSERLYYPEYDAAESVTTGLIRYYGTSYWQALQDSTGESPAEGDYWTAYSIASWLIPWTDHTDATDIIGTPVRVSDFNPKITDAGCYYGFTLTEDGLYLESVAAGKVWVEHMPPVPSLSGDAWDEETAYVANEQVYYEPLGNFYKALQSDTGTVPGSDADVWEVVTIPAKFLMYLVWDVHSKELGGDSQTKERLRAEEKALDHLYRTMDIAHGMAGVANQAVMGGRNR